MKIAILSNDPLLYSTRALKNVGENRGHQIQVINYLDCNFAPLVSGQNPVIRLKSEILPIFDIAILRIGYFALEHSARILEFFPAKIFINNAINTIKAKDKWHQATILARNNIPIPPTHFISIVSPINLSQNDFPIVLKKCQSSQGKDVTLINSNDALISSVNEMASGRNNCVIQPYIAESLNSDYRLLVVDKKVIGAMKRTAKKGEFRANAHLGAKCSKYDPTPHEIEIAIKATESLGLIWAGVDIIKSNRGPLVIEVNSSPGLEKITPFCKVNPAEYLFQYLERTYC